MPSNSSRRSSIFAASHSALLPQSITTRTFPPDKPDPAASPKNQQPQQQSSRQKNMIVVKFVYSRELKLAVEKLAAERLAVVENPAVSSPEWRAESPHHQPRPDHEPNVVHGFPIVLYRVREIADVIEERERLRQERLAKLRELQQRVKREKLLQKQRKRGAKISNKAVIESKTSLSSMKPRANKTVK